MHKGIISLRNQITWRWSLYRRRKKKNKISVKIHNISSQIRSL